MATHSGSLAWKIPWTEEPDRLQSMRSLRVGHDWTTSLSLFTFMPWRRKWQPAPVFLPGESQGQGEPGGLPSMGLHRVRHDWSDLAAPAAVCIYPKLLIYPPPPHFPFVNLFCCCSVAAAAAAAAAKSRQSCPTTLCNPIDGSPPGSAAPGILQARTLEWVAISFSNAWK